MTVSSSSNLVYKDIVTEISYYKTTWTGLLLFELKSFIGRHFLTKRKLNINAAQTNFLNLGCGYTFLTDNWVNADFFGVFLPRKSNILRPDWMLDLRYPLQCPNHVWDGVFTEHTLEHLYPDDALNLLKELHRTMKSQAWLRVTVPDLQQFVDYYEGRAVNPEFLRWKTGGHAIHALTQNYYHLSVWNEQLLTEFLIMSGFTNIKKVSFQQGTDRRLCHDREERRWETLYMEAQKP